MSDHEQILCLAHNIYWEARNQPLKGMIAVGHVTLNRVRDDRFPDNTCDVIYEGPETESWKTRKDPNLPDEKRLYYPKRNKCQFSWYCDGKSDEILEQERYVYEISLAVAFKVFYNNFRDNTGGATHYHADYVSPKWRHDMQYMTKIGNHLFYVWK